ncbi:PH domain-containing protein [Nonomuraea sp. LPB2021202275-12-8]|uniref:PH domain-containing protein n=1 Tax=Nonomuraea sp. LPB2021202275-12-8 TaxID=3120159 RepID=UPI00300CEC53
MIGESWQALSPRGLRVSGIRSLAIAAPVVTVLARVLAGLDWPLWPIVAATGGAGVVVVAGALAYEAARLRATRWRLTADRLEVRTGVAVRQHRSIPRDRVRSVDVRADPVRRAFGLTLVKVGTGEHADAHSELVLDSLTGHDAEALRRSLLRQEAPVADVALAQLRWAWARYAPLSVWSFAGGALVLGALYKTLDLLGLDLFTSDVAAGVWDWVTGRPWMAVPALLAANAALGVVGALLLFAESWGRYRLEREPGRLRLSRGLLTNRSLTLQERRLRGVEISEPLLLRLGGGARVKAVATGLGKAGEDESEDVAALTPPLPRELAVQVAARVAGMAPVSPSPHPVAARRRRIVWSLATVASLAALAAGATWLAARGGRPAAASGQSWPAGWFWPSLGAATALALPVALWLAADAYRALGHALSERHLICRRGTLTRRTVALDRGGIVGWTLSATVSQRRSGLLTVTATTAAGDGHYDVADVGRGDGLDLAARAVPGLLEPFLVRSQ